MAELLQTPYYSRRYSIVPAAYPRQPGTTKSPKDRLDIALWDYCFRTPEQGALSLIFTHGTSFNKALWHMTIDALLSDDDLHGKLARIIAIDAVTHGDSALINKEKLGSECFWIDNSCDILSVVQHLNLKGPVVGIGHSFGGGALAHAALMSPTTFAAAIFVDPILYVMPEQDKMAAKSALARRDEWADVNEVKGAFAKSKGLADWHPRQREVYAESGTTLVDQDAKTGRRTLTTPKSLEAATYIAAPHPELPAMLKESKANHTFVLGGKSRVISEEQRNDIRDMVVDPSQIKVIVDAGHLIPMTHPHELTAALKSFLLVGHDRRKDLTRRSARL